MMSLFRKEGFFFFMVAIATLVVVATVWFFTPLPTIAARYVWDEWHAGELALAWPVPEGVRAGVFFARLTHSGASRTRRFVLLGR